MQHVGTFSRIVEVNKRLALASPESHQPELLQLDWFSPELIVVPSFYWFFDTSANRGVNPAEMHDAEGQTTLSVMSLMYIHSPIAHTFSVAQFVCAHSHTSSCVSHTRMDQVHEKGVGRIRMSFSISPSLSQVSLIFCCSRTSLRDHS